MMLLMRRNKKSFYYALYERKEPVTDEYGNQTGEYRIVYSDPILEHGNISPGSGDAQNEIFGTEVKYSRVIALDDINCPIDENSVIFVDVTPTKNADGEYNNDYVVKAIAPSINNLLIAIEKV